MNASDLFIKALENEGVEVIDNQIQDFNKIFWDPFIELPLN